MASAFERLPELVLDKVLQYLDLQDIIALNSCCSFLRNYPYVNVRYIRLLLLFPFSSAEIAVSLLLDRLIHLFSQSYMFLERFLVKGCTV